MKPRLSLLIVLVLGAVSGLTAWGLTNDPMADPRSGAGTDGAPLPDSYPTNGGESSTPSAAASLATRTGYIVTRAGAELRAGPAEVGTAVAGGIALPVMGETAEGYWVLDTCNRDGWLAADQVEAGLVPDQPAEGRMDRAVFVIDPGHGLPDYGAIGPNGLTETEVNLDVSGRLAELLGRSNDVDWTTGQVTPGTEVPAVAAAVLTRGPDGPNGGDYQLGLTFRATLGNAVDATALVSVHHNTQPEQPLDHPGSEAFVSVANPESSRLGGLIVEELRASLARFDADWMGSAGPGLTSRVGADGEDYYTVLSRSMIPAVIVEGAYISNPSEEALAMTDEFRQAYAEAVYRALVRFVTTDDEPIPPPDPQLWEVDRPGPSLSDCTVPSP